MAGCRYEGKSYTYCTITVEFDPRTSSGTLTVSGQDKAGEQPSVLLTASVVVGGDGHMTPTGTFHASRWEKDHVSTQYGILANTPYSKTVAGINAFGPYQLHIAELENRGIYIHGTIGPRGNPWTFVSKLVSRTSHGCVRMANADNIKLYEMMTDPKGNLIIIKTVTAK